jgi:hypothetical protein
VETGRVGEENGGTVAGPFVNLELDTVDRVAGRDGFTHSEIVEERRER